MSYLRQRKLGDVVKSLNNVVSCEVAVPGSGAKWEQKDEVADLYCAYVGHVRGAAFVCLFATFRLFT